MVEWGTKNKSRTYLGLGRLGFREHISRKIERARTCREHIFAKKRLRKSIEEIKGNRKKSMTSKENQMKSKETNGNQEKQRQSTDINDNRRKY